ncbi:MAG: M42 family metallopeptidase [Candidatus Verstraetearchaeota archaeon]|nr:M42 family metallopeptidase [Candidatus Verstraetearchaeota archaeon]
MDIDLLRRLSEAHGVSGSEFDLGQIIKDGLEGNVSRITEDRFGNIFAEKGQGERTIMVASHADEIGLIVKHIDEKGFIRFAKLGGIADQILPAQRVLIHGAKKKVPGVIGCKAVHVMKDEERKQLVTYDKMFIDTGATKEQLESYGVRVGTPVTFLRGMTELENDLVVGKAMDDRAGCFVLIEALKRASPKNRVVGVFTVQEEVGLRGATMSAFAVKPDIGIAIDTTIAGDHPELSEQDAPVKLGKGPTIVIADGRKDSLGGGMISNPIIRNWLVELAESNKIPYQLEVLEGGTTDAAAIQMSQSGIPSACLSIPSRYVHSFSEVISKKDLENCIELLVKAMESNTPF